MKVADRCGRQNHSAKSYPFKDTKCHECGKLGHLQKVCMSKITNHNSSKEEWKGPYLIIEL